MTILTYIVFFALMATVGVLVAGVILMAIGGEANRKYGNRLMQWRVKLQALAIALIAALFFLSAK